MQHIGTARQKHDIKATTNHNIKALHCQCQVIVYQEIIKY